MSWLLIFSAWSTVRPLIISVSAELDAIAEPQPKVWKPASRMTSVSGSTLRVRRRASPQLSEPTSPTALASTTAPAFFGL
ncbi:hypothetical protein D3C80_1377500 [compost metagenome]